ncbi:MAG: glycosyltransferase family 4 protein [Saprospiraceae bacterium]
MDDFKILIVANSGWNIINFRFALIQHLKDQGFMITVVAPEDPYSSEIRQCSFLNFIPLKNLQANSINIFRDLFLVKELYSIYKREHPDLILQFTIKPNIYGSLAAKLLNLKVVSTITGLGYAFTKQRWFQKPIEFIYKLALSFNEFVFFHNADDLNYFIDKSILKFGVGSVIPGSGVDTDYFKKSAADEKSSYFNFLLLGRLIEEKGVREFVEAAKLIKRDHRNCCFYIAGKFLEKGNSAIPRTELNAWIQEQRIEYLGDSKDVKSLISNCDVVVLPSYREGLPRAILEAMAMEKPVIVTDVPGCRDLVLNSMNGYIVPPRNIKLLAKAFEQMLELSTNERIAMGLAGRQMVLDKYDLKIILTHYDILLRKLDLLKEA